jgi:hypothetical protein
MMGVCDEIYKRLLFSIIYSIGVCVYVVCPIL